MSVPAQTDAALARAEDWFAARGWTPFPFQRETWRRFRDGESGLVHAPTGFGKSLAAWMGALCEGAEEAGAQAAPKRRADAPPLQILWLTPMRALAADLVRNLHDVAQEIAPGWLVEARSGDTSSTVRSRQARRLPTALVTTPESLTLLLSHDDAAERFASLRCVVVDEWHELFGTKRGVQTELALARLRTLAPAARTWGLSATLGNLDEAARALVGAGKNAPRIVRGEARRDLSIETLVPSEVERFPWAGHMGLNLLDSVARQLDSAQSAIVFTNTRAQSERWFQALSYARYERREDIALHHGSLDREDRADVEERLADGRVWVVVATSSLDLGVDFTPVDLVLQVGSPKGVARLLQRAGRSGHSPGRASRLINVPANALELVEFAAARDAADRGEFEPRPATNKPLDVLAQHVVTVAAAGGFFAPELLAEVRTTASYFHLSDDEWRWTLEFARYGGEALAGYERFARIVVDESTQRVKVGSKRIARDHRMNIGTIAGFGSLQVAYRNGRKLGSVEEMFVTRLRAGESFTFAGKPLELVRIHEGTAYVRAAKSKATVVPRWYGGRMPLSNELSHAVRRAIGEVREAHQSRRAPDAPELAAVAPLFDLQAQRSRIPAAGELLIERLRTKDGDHAYLFPLAGRLAHEGLAALLSWRLTRRQNMTVSQAVSDWGIELGTRGELPVADDAWRELLSPEGLAEDLHACLEGTELARRQFREIARVAGLVHSGMPGKRKGQRQLQASAGLIFDVLSEHDEGNLLLEQARREVMERMFEVDRLRRALEELRTREIVMERPARLTPLAFPLWAERVRDRVSSESWEDRVRAMATKLETP